MGLFTVFNRNDKAKNKSLIKNLIEVAVSDGKLDDSEFDLIVEIAGKHDISKADVLSIKENYQEIEFIAPLSNIAKVSLMEDLIRVLLADKFTEENEVKVCKELAKKLKLNCYVVDDLINSILNKI